MKDAQPSCRLAMNLISGKLQRPSITAMWLSPGTQKTWRTPSLRRHSATAWPPNIAWVPPVPFQFTYRLFAATVNVYLVALRMRELRSDTACRAPTIATNFDATLAILSSKDFCNEKNIFDSRVADADGFGGSGAGGQAPNAERARDLHRAGSAENHSRRRHSRRQN